MNSENTVHNRSSTQKVIHSMNSICMKCPEQEKLYRVQLTISIDNREIGSDLYSAQDFFFWGDKNVLKFDSGDDCTNS